jgi:hypothetical protein
VDGNVSALRNRSRPLPPQCCAYIFPQDLNRADGVYFTCRVAVMIAAEPWSWYTPSHNYIVIGQSFILLRSITDLYRKPIHHRRCHHVHLTNTPCISQSRTSSL